MKTREQDIQAVKNLRHGQHCYVSWHEEGGGEVFLIWNRLFLFMIPQYGGEGQHVCTFHESEAEAVVDYANTFT